MRKVLFSIMFIGIANVLLAQSTKDQKPLERKGFTFGFSVGAGALTISTNDTVSTILAATLPNLHFGYMLSNNFALQLLLPGSPYQYNGKARGFEGILFTGQYWVKNNWWLLGGTGLTLDAPAFWTVKDPKDADFNIGFPALTFAMGYEVWRKKKFALDVQYRIYAGQTKLENSGTRQGISNMFSVGFNWY